MYPKLAATVALPVAALIEKLHDTPTGRFENRGCLRNKNHHPMTSNHEHGPSLHSGIMGISTFKITHKLRTRLPLSAAVVCLVFESVLAQPIAKTETHAPAQTVAADSIILPAGFNDP